jgi:hypothetical protein
MGFSFASVLLSYFLIAGGTFGTALLAGRFGIRSEYLGYIILAIGGFLGGVIAARASRGSTIIEPAVGAVLLILSLVGLGAAVSGAEARQALILPSTMKAIALTALASGAGGVGGAFVAEKLMGDEPPRYASWILFVAIAAFGAGVLGSTFGTVLGHGQSGPLLGMLALFCFILGTATGASASTRPLGAAFLGGSIGLGGFFYLTILLFMALFNTKAAASTSIPSEMYGGIAIMAIGGGIATLMGAAVGWATVGKKA